MNEFTWQGEYASAAQERRYCLVRWPQLAMRTRVVCGLTSLLYLASVGGDYLSANQSESLSLLLSLRLACFALGWGCVLLTFSRRFLLRLPWFVALYVFSLCAAEAVTIATGVHQPLGMDQSRMLFTLLFILAFYMLLPLRLLPVMLGAGLGSVACIAAMAMFTPAASPQVYTASMFFIMVNIFGAYYLKGANTTLRNEFRSQREERLLQRRLRRETAQRRKAQAQLQLVATTDDLTGIFNRRRFLEACREELARFRRYSLPAAVLLLDVDQFRRVNDEHGHEAGDKTLQALAAHLVGLLRTTDTVGRLGGEEFGVLLPGTETDDALAVARKLHTSLATQPLSLEAGSLQITLSLSIGVVLLSPRTNSPEDLLHVADLALAKAKRTSGEHVCLLADDADDSMMEHDSALASA